MKYIILIASFFLFLNTNEAYGQKRKRRKEAERNKERIENFCNEHKAEILSLYLAYEKLDKFWTERTENAEHEETLQYTTGEVNDGRSYYYMIIKAKEIVKKEESEQLQMLLKNTDIVRAMFWVGASIEGEGLVTQLVFPEEFNDENRANGMDWDQDISWNTSSIGYGYVYFYEKEGREDIYIFCNLTTSQEEGVPDIVKVEVTSKTRPKPIVCAFYYQL